MPKIKAIIVDDERLSRVNLRRLLMLHDEIEIVGEVGSCKSAIEVIGQLKPELIFLDIQLKGESGIKIIEIVDRSVKIVLTTALDDYSDVHDFGLNVFDYLLKPVNPKRLKYVVESLVSMEHTQKNTANYKYS